jgi:hypothetical protein
MAGGLRFDAEAKRRTSLLAVPPTFTTLPWYEGRMYCIESSDQGNNPHCAGEAMAGYIEGQRWANEYIVEQISGSKLYKVGKEFDSDKRDGTTFECVIRAAKELGYVSNEAKTRMLETKRDVLFGLHKHKLVMAGFNITTDWNYCDSKTGWISDEHGAEMGGHAVLICWANDTGDGAKGIGFQNSWGKWGVKGFGRMTWEQFEKQFMGGYVLE